MPGGGPDDFGTTVANKIVPMVRWACASQQAIPSSVREPLKPLPFVFKGFIVLMHFLFRKHLGISVGFPEALVWITVFAFLYVFNVWNVASKIAPMARWAFLVLKMFQRFDVHSCLEELKHFPCVF